MPDVYTAEPEPERMWRSPLDSSPGRPVTTLVQLQAPPKQEWMPSRYNARTVTDDGRVILWNTYTRAISVVAPRQRPTLERLLSQKGFTGKLSGLAQYLYDKGFIVQKNTDELRRFRLLFGQQHYRKDLLQLILLASEDCNFRCTYCYEEFKRGTMLPEIREGVKNLLRKRIRYLREFTVSWFGGEPLYGMDAVRDLAPFFQRVTQEHGVAYAAHMTTNGYLLTSDVADELLSWQVRDFQITLDGPAEAHDQKRKGRDGQKTFQVIYDNLRMLARRQEHFSVVVRINFDKENYPLLHDFLSLLEADFAHDQRFKVAFHAVGQWGGPNDADLAVCGDVEMRDVSTRIVALARTKGLGVRSGVLEINRPGAWVCYAARPQNFIVGADGKLMKCTIALDTEDDNIVGHITAEGDLVLDHDKLSFWTQPAFETDPLCQNCYILPTCQGMACPLERLHSGKRACCATKKQLRTELLAALERPGHGVTIGEGPLCESAGATVTSRV